MSNDLLTGVIDAEPKSAVFSVRDNSFDFCFMTDSVYSFQEENTLTKLPSSHGFICGKTHDGHSIAIYLGNTSFEFFGKGLLNAYAYVVSSLNTIENDIMEYEAIQFVGGTLNKVFLIDGLKMKYEKDGIILKYNDDSITFFVNTKEYSMEIEVYSFTNECRGISGKSIANNDVVLNLKFNQPQPLSTIFDHYNCIKDLMSFMTFRDNVGFKEINLLKTHPEIGLSTSAHVYIQNEKEFTTKMPLFNLCFQNLGETLPNLIKLIYDTEDKKQALSLGFLPADDSDIDNINDTKIRAICSALECELNFVTDINADENCELEELVNLTRDTVKKFRLNHNALSDDTYNLIFSNIKIWSFTLAEKLCALYHKFEQEMLVMNSSQIFITDELIREFVKYRNDITHGKHRTLSTGIAVTAFLMCGLVYCCVLERIGISRDDILTLCRSNLLS